MSHRILSAVGIVGSAAFLAPTLALAQGPSSEQRTWTAPRTAYDQPDLQGLWTMATYTPLERAKHLAGKEFFTEEETANLQRVLTAEGVDPLGARTAINEVDEEKRDKKLQQTKENIHYDNAIWLATTKPKGLSTRRTSLIVDPPDGRIPPLTAKARKRRAELNATRGFDSHEGRSLTERCIAWRHEGTPMLPPSYNDLLRIVQTPDHVAIFQEMSNHGARIIPLDGRPHLPPSVRLFPGDSRGHWEGDTLVVDTINFTDKTRFAGSGEALHVVERFTRVGADSIRYEFTVEDPESWTRPWSAEIPMMRTEGPMFEYACHEGNYDVANILRVARAQEKEAEATTETK